MTGKPLTGRKVFAIFVTAFGVIIAVNLVLAFSAVRTFPGLEVKNSYVASQRFDADRAAQEALGWTAAARIEGGLLRLDITDADGLPAPIDGLEAVLGRATHVQDDRVPAFARPSGSFVAPVDLAPGNWNLRIAATAANGTVFRQRIVLRVGDAQ